MRADIPLLSAIKLKAASGTAAPIDAAVPTVTLLEETLSGEMRIVRLWIASQRGAHEFGALIASPGGIYATELFGERVSYDAPLPELMLNNAAMPAEGFKLTLTLRRDQPLSLRIADVTPGLPVLAGQPAPRALIQ